MSSLKLVTHTHPNVSLTATHKLAAFHLKIRIDCLCCPLMQVMDCEETMAENWGCLFCFVCFEGCICVHLCQRTRSYCVNRCQRDEVFVLGLYAFLTLPFLLKSIQ